MREDHPPKVALQAGIDSTIAQAALALKEVNPDSGELEEVRRAYDAAMSLVRQMEIALKHRDAALRDLDAALRMRDALLRQLRRTMDQLPEVGQVTSPRPRGRVTGITADHVVAARETLRDANGVPPSIRAIARHLGVSHTHVSNLLRET